MLPTSFNRFEFEYPPEILELEKNQDFILLPEGRTEVPLNLCSSPINKKGLYRAMERIRGEGEVPEVLTITPDNSLEDVSILLDKGICFFVTRVEKYLNSAIEACDYIRLDNFFSLVRLSSTPDRPFFSGADYRKVLKISELGYKIYLTPILLHNLDEKLIRCNVSNIKKYLPVLSLTRVIVPYIFDTPTQKELKRVFPLRESYSTENVLRFTNELYPEVLKEAISRFKEDSSSLSLPLTVHPQIEIELRKADIRISFVVESSTFCEPKEHFRMRITTRMKQMISQGKSEAELLTILEWMNSDFGIIIQEICKVVQNKVALKKVLLGLLKKRKVNLLFLIPLGALDGVYFTDIEVKGLYHPYDYKEEILVYLTNEGVIMKE